MVLWVFGYGSLVWNPGFDFDEKIIGYIKDYRRVFDLGIAFGFKFEEENGPFFFFAYDNILITFLFSSPSLH